MYGKKVYVRIEPRNCCDAGLLYNYSPSIIFLFETIKPDVTRPSKCRVVHRRIRAADCYVGLLGVLFYSQHVRPTVARNLYITDELSV